MALFDTKKKLRHKSKTTSPTGQCSTIHLWVNTAPLCPYTVTTPTCRAPRIKLPMFTSTCLLQSFLNGSVSQHLADVCVFSYPSSINTKWRHTKKDCLSLYQGKSPFALYCVDFTKGILRPIISKRWREIEIDEWTLPVTKRRKKSLSG